MKLDNTKRKSWTKILHFTFPNSLSVICASLSESHSPFSKHDSAHLDRRKAAPAPRPCRPRQQLCIASHRPSCFVGSPTRASTASTGAQSGRRAPGSDHLKEKEAGRKISTNEGLPVAAGTADTAGTAAATTSRRQNSSPSKGRPHTIRHDRDEH